MSQDQPSQDRRGRALDQVVSKALQDFLPQEGSEESELSKTGEGSFEESQQRERNNQEIRQLEEQNKDMAHARGQRETYSDKTFKFMRAYTGVIILTVWIAGASLNLSGMGFSSGEWPHDVAHCHHSCGHGSFCLGGSRIVFTKNGLSSHGAKKILR